VSYFIRRGIELWLLNSFWPLPGVRDMEAFSRSATSPDEYLNALSHLSGQPIFLETKNFRGAVDDFIGATEALPSGLDYRLRTWLLLLIYDGLNIFCRNQGLTPLRGFEEQELVHLNSPCFPRSVRAAAGEVLNYMRSYPLKYFLAPRAKIRGSLARQLLIDLAAGVS
jgi:hypothetical protein